MKKIILASLCLTSALSFTGCVSEEDDIFDASAPVRLEEAAKTYTERLAASAGGWAMEYYPTEETSSPKGNGSNTCAPAGKTPATTANRQIILALFIIFFYEDYQEPGFQRR